MVRQTMRLDLGGRCASTLVTTIDKGVETRDYDVLAERSAGVTTTTGSGKRAVFAS